MAKLLFERALGQKLTDFPASHDLWREFLGFVAQTMSGRKKNAEFVISIPIMSNQGRDRNRDLQFEGGKHFSLHA